MTDIIFCGANGRMGHAFEAVVADSPDFRIAAGIDINVTPNPSYPIYSDIGDYDGHADVIIDFSHHSALPSLLEYARVRNLPIVVATTGHTEGELALMKGYSGFVPIFHSGNMSLGINLLIGLAKKAAAILGTDFDIEIIEAHHNRKLDAPSGTALMIADAISETVAEKTGDKPEYVYDRTSRREVRPNNEIGIHSIRAGGIVGEHEVLFGGKNEEVKISHTAYSRSVFASGALKAAEYLIGKPAGLYSMTDLVSEITE